MAEIHAERWATVYARVFPSNILRWLLTVFIGGYLLASHLFMLFLVTNNVVYFVHNIRWLDCYWTYKWFTSKCRCIRGKWGGMSGKKDARNVFLNFRHVFVVAMVCVSTAKPKKFNLELWRRPEHQHHLHRFISICLVQIWFLQNFVGIVYRSFHIQSQYFALQRFKRCKTNRNDEILITCLTSSGWE